MMLTGLPQDFGQTVHQIIQTYGNPVIYRRQGVADQPLKALVQQPADRALQADASQDGMVIFFSAQDVPARPLQFDRVVVDNEERTIDTGQPEGANGQIFAWRCWVIG